VLRDLTYFTECLFKNQEQVNFDYVDIDEQIVNRFNHIRRKFVKTAFNNGLIDYDNVLDIYNKWRNDDEYIVLRGIEQFKQKTLDGSIQSKIGNYVYRFIKASKRGNDVYRYIIKKKFKQIEEIDTLEFFRDDFKRKKTKLLFITLTFDTKECKPIESWYKIPILFNRFKANLTKKYGKISTFRVWESTQKYYAHIHCLIYFKDYEFEVFKHINKKGQTSYRIPYYQVSKIKEYYPYDIDIQACESFNKAIQEITKYVGKYLIKESVDDKPTKTNAMIWLTNKQGYSLSKGFFKEIIGKELDVSEPKSADLTNYMCNSNFNVEVWEYVGIISSKEIGISGNIWFFEAKHPPPKAMEKINILISEKLSR
jgi:hypothetical protein